MDSSFFFFFFNKIEYLKLTGFPIFLTADHQNRFESYARYTGRAKRFRRTVITFETTMYFQPKFIELVVSVLNYCVFVLIMEIAVRLALCAVNTDSLTTKTFSVLFVDL